LNEGIKARDRGAAARGGLLSGAQQKAIERYGQEVASTDYDTWVNREWSNYFNALKPYQQMSSEGQNAAANTANLGMNYANSSSNIMTGTGSNVANTYNSMANNALTGANMQANMMTQAANANASGIWNAAMIPYQQNLYNTDIARQQERINNDLSLSKELADQTNRYNLYGDIFKGIGAFAGGYLSGN